MLRTLVKAVAPRRVRWAGASFLWKQLGARVLVASDVGIAIRGPSDWYAFNELFVGGEYDSPIRQALAAGAKRDTFRVVDVGANIGFFALRVASLAKQNGRDLSKVRVWSFEGSPSNFAKLSHNTGGWRQSWPGFTAIHGLVGARSGHATIYEQAEHLTTSVHRPTNGRGIDVPFVDLDPILGDDGQPFDLLKCDIEGGELEFLRNYPGILARTEMFVGEFHHDLCDVSACKALLAEAGLEQGPVLSREKSQMGETTTEVFQRR